MTLRISLLGPAEIRRDDQVLDLPGYRQGIIDWVEGADLDSVLQEIDDSWLGEE